ncbi:unnamed protein product [Protopolystoma xenopodis]|uniref:Uncharacterized protein n=1 Tax=Protopolystoma xenopodis TaxID=117903 RepID=A0A448WNI9_9PLAT|nr:unnamed protein product [Protopolystoma xenopodis]
MFALFIYTAHLNSILLIINTQVHSAHLHKPPCFRKIASSTSKTSSRGTDSIVDCHSPKNPTCRQLLNSSPFMFGQRYGAGDHHRRDKGYLICDSLDLDGHHHQRRNSKDSAFWCWRRSHPCSCHRPVRSYCRHCGCAHYCGCGDDNTNCDKCKFARPSLPEGTSEPPSNNSSIDIIQSYCPFSYCHIQPKVEARFTRLREIHGRCTGTLLYHSGRPLSSGANACCPHSSQCRIVREAPEVMHSEPDTNGLRRALSPNCSLPLCKSVALTTTGHQLPPEPNSIIPPAGSPIKTLTPEDTRSHAGNVPCIGGIVKGKSGDSNYHVDLNALQPCEIGDGMKDTCSSKVDFSRLSEIASQENEPAMDLSIPFMPECKWLSL